MKLNTKEAFEQIKAKRKSKNYVLSAPKITGENVKSLTKDLRQNALFRIRSLSNSWKRWIGNSH